MTDAASKCDTERRVRRESGRARSIGLHLNLLADLTAANADVWERYELRSPQRLAFISVPQHRPAIDRHERLFSQTMCNCHRSKRPPATQGPTEHLNQ